MTTAMGPDGPWTHHLATVGGVRLHYVRQGAGVPIVLLHGWPGFWYEWAPVIPALARDHDVVVPDLRGFAYSDKPDLAPEVGYARDVVAREVAALLGQLGLERVAVVAHDIGATVAQPLARLRPDLVARLVLFDPPYPGIGRRWREPGHVREIWYQVFHTLPWAPDLVGASRDSIRIYLRHFLTHWSARTDWVTDAELEHWVDAYAQPGALRGGFSYYRARERTRTAEGDMPAAEFRVDVPTLVLWGEGDAVLPVAWADRLPEYFSALTLERVPGVGHFMMREAPDLVVDRVRAYVAPVSEERR
jgi:pimeloyl-ACP methyl ester carboxylesterase